jgi:hypothetical protein
MFKIIYQQEKHMDAKFQKIMVNFLLGKQALSHHLCLLNSNKPHCGTTGLISDGEN